MIKLWEFLWHGCWHDWQYKQTQSIVKEEGGVPYGHNIIYQCSKCNRIKAMEL